MINNQLPAGCMRGAQGDRFRLRRRINRDLGDAVVESAIAFEHLLIRDDHVIELRGSYSGFPIRSGRPKPVAWMNPSDIGRSRMCNSDSDIFCYRRGTFPRPLTIP